MAVASAGDEVLGDPVGKALNDPVKGVSALTGSVSFTKARRPDRGDGRVGQREAQKVILGELRRSSAEARRQPVRPCPAS